MTTKHRVILYHDEADEAATDTKSLGLFDTQDDAIKAAREEFGAYWMCATIDIGEWDEGEPGVRPSLFTERTSAPQVYLGPDWIDR